MEIETKEKIHTGLFSDIHSADAAYQAALDRGYKREEINVLMSEDTRNKNYSSTLVKSETGDKSMEGLALGGALGGTALGIIGAVVALSTTIVVPGVGLVIAGPLAAGLVGAGAGSIAGGFVGALIGAGIPEERATIYENGIKKGEILITVSSHSDDEDNELMKDWKKNNGKDVF
ncbi:MAG: hypothetical protein JO149_03750 [Gammaproteobacteria bacterium]|nr:hypothetical protein [Gammaproteobacteria bacterium]